MTATETMIDSGIGDGADFDTVLHDPAAYFATPQAVLDDPMLSDDEKRHVLAEWQIDLDNRRSATEEGMTADQPGIIDQDVKLGEALVAARGQLGSATDPAERPSLPARLWRRITGAA